MTVEEYLKTQGIKFEVYEHPAVFTCQEAEMCCAHVPGKRMKNILLNNSKKSRYFLVLLPACMRLDLKAVEAEVGEKHLSFSSPETLLKKLELTPGAVSPFGLINNKEKDVELVVNRQVSKAQYLSFHPNRNTASVSIGRGEFNKFLEGLGIKAKVFG